MKGELLRKRYFLLLTNAKEELVSLEQELYGTFRAKSKFREFPYLIVLTDQFQKEHVSHYIEKNFPNVKIVGVSGTIKKLKTEMK